VGKHFSTQKMQQQVCRKRRRLSLPLCQEQNILHHVDGIIFTIYYSLNGNVHWICWCSVQFLSHNCKKKNIWATPWTSRYILYHRKYPSSFPVLTSVTGSRSLFAIFAGVLRR